MLGTYACWPFPWGFWRVVRTCRDRHILIFVVLFVTIFIQLASWLIPSACDAMMPDAITRPVGDPNIIPVLPGESILNGLIHVYAFPMYLSRKMLGYEESSVASLMVSAMFSIGACSIVLTPIIVGVLRRLLRSMEDDNVLNVAQIGGDIRE